MSFSIGSANPGMGPRGILEDFGAKEPTEGEAFNPHVVRRMLEFLRPYSTKMVIAFCLMLVIEGIMPFLSPSGWRAMVLSVTGMSDRALRVAGLCAMVAGTALLYAIN